MDPKTAYEILYGVTGQVSANRDTHIQTLQALDVIRKELGIESKAPMEHSVPKEVPEREKVEKQAEPKPMTPQESDQRR